MVAASSLFAVLATTGYVMAAAVLPRVEEELPCLQPSLNFEKWTVSDFTYSWIKTTSATDPTNTYTNSEVKFKVSSNALSSGFECTRKKTSTEFRDDEWFNCPGTIISNMEFSYNSETLVLSLNSGWACMPKQFQHAGSVKIPLDCTTEHEEKGIPFSIDSVKCASPGNFDVPSKTPHAPPLY
ncbi:hypothetical protein CFIMG_006189RA [Ceratocystis fimbriata CBS 114723]|uniref:Uncharacterized protein n=1 Tax=Ceratocystis fimbriata CBS 114723 TaxID=1035309 RepID=A0A2C5WWI2_9PEZI|nr:hypothetical protein CFIMG_006189RA [Ceratocystis fimbriata CBS 114723]